MPKKTFIPKTNTQIFGREIKIEHRHVKEDCKSSTLYGSIDLKTGTVILRKSQVGDWISDDEREITYLHEIIHFILNKMGYEEKLEKANINLEDLVETIAIGIYDALKNAK